MKRFMVVLVLVAAGVIVAALQVPSRAASVNGSGISRQSVNDELTAISSNPNYACFIKTELALSAQNGSQLQIGGVGANGTYDVNFADVAVDQLIDNALIDQVVRAKGLKVSPGDLVIGRALIDQRINNVLTSYAQALGLSSAPCGASVSGVLSYLPASFINQQVQAQAEQALLEAHAVGASLDAAGSARYFNAHRVEFDTVCVSDIAVTSQAEAAFIRGAILNRSSSFAAQAQANSIDTSTKSKGGAAGCAPAASFRFAQLVSLPVGQVTQPISTNGVYVILTVTSRTPSNFAGLTGLVRSVILASGQAKAQAELTNQLKRSTITADPRYGQVVQGSTALLVPPSSPLASSLVSPRANIPGGNLVSGSG